MKIKNTTDIPTETLRRIIRFCLPENVDLPGRVRLTNSRHAYGGRYSATFHGDVLLRIGATKKYPTRIRPYQYAQHRGRKVWVGSRLEGVVYLAAHELRHHWQGKGRMRNSFFPTGYVRNAKGKWSEVDTEAYAIHTLRAWRRAESNRTAALPKIS